MNLEIIATAHNGFTDKFGIPRQSQEASLIETKIVFEPAFRDENMLRGIEGFSHLWLIWEFSQAIGREAERLKGTAASSLEEERLKGTAASSLEADRQWKATVRPPRLGGNTRMGVFATRSPFRPNRLGLSSVELVKVEKTANEGTVLVVRGADLMDGTPIYDIKPYLSYSDSHPDARNGFGEATRDYRLKVEWVEGAAASSLEAERMIGGKVERQKGAAASSLKAERRRGKHQTPDTRHQTPGDRLQIEEILSQDPRPAYQDDPERIYKLDYAGWKVSFRVEGDTVYIQKIEKTD